MATEELKAAAELAARDTLTAATADVLRGRGVEFRDADIYGFVAAAWPTESDAEELADDWEEASEAK